MNFVKSITGTIHIADENNAPICKTRGLFSPIKPDNDKVSCKKCLAKTQPTAVPEMETPKTSNDPIVEEPVVDESNLPARLIVINYNKKSEGPLYKREIHSQADYDFCMEFLLGANNTGGYQLLMERQDGTRIKSRYAAKRYALAIT